MAMEDNSLPVSRSAKSKRMASETTFPLQQKITLKTSDGMDCEVELGTAMMCPLLAREIMHRGIGPSSGSSISLPEKVRGIVLDLIFEYCLFYQVRGHSNKEEKLFHQKFIKLDLSRSVELFHAAHSLGMDHLEDLAIQGIVRTLRCMTPEKIRETLGIPESERPTEALLLKATFDAKSHVFVTNTVVQEQKKKKDEVEEVGQSSSPENGNLDAKPLEDLVSQIDRKEASKSKSRKKRNKKKNRQAKDSSLDESTGKATQSTHSTEDSPSADQDRDIEEEIKVTEETDGAQNGVGCDQEELHFDDSLDPVDKEVMEFERLLNISWLDRRQEVLTLANTRKESIKVIGEIDALPVP